MAIDATTREIIGECLSRIQTGDSCAPFDLAGLVMAHADSKDIELNLAIVEALAHAAKQRGCEAAGSFLGDEWEGMKHILRKRWARNGLIASEQ